MEPEKQQSQFLVELLNKLAGNTIVFFKQGFSFLRFDSEKTREQFKDIFNTTSDQVREKAEETRRAVKLRMAVLEIEHHLNRLYPQIGKLICDLSEEGKKTFHQNPEIKAKLELAAEYRERLVELRSQQSAQYESERKKG